MNTFAKCKGLESFAFLSLKLLSAELYNSQGRYSEAEPSQERPLRYLQSSALFILEKVLPANHPNLAIVRENLEGLRSQIEQPTE